MWRRNTMSYMPGTLSLRHKSQEAKHQATLSRQGYDVGNAAVVSATAPSSCEEFWVMNCRVEEGRRTACRDCAVMGRRER
jgi:hypothetical protein